MAERKGASYRVTARRSGGDPNAHAQTTNASEWARTVLARPGGGIGGFYPSPDSSVVRPGFSMDFTGERVSTGGPAGAARRYKRR